MVTAVLPIPQATLLNGSKSTSSESPPSHVPSTSNGVKSKGIYKAQANGVTKPEYYVNGYHKDIPTPSQRVQEPRNSCDVVFGPKDKEDNSYRMLNQPLGQKRPLKVIYLGGGASGKLVLPRFSLLSVIFAHTSIRSRTAINFVYRARSHLPDIDLVCYEKNSGLTGTCRLYQTAHSCRRSS
jgi:hypothetical protein